MKSEVLKKFIKEAVREAIQEELKDILLEAIKSPKPTLVQESTSNIKPPLTQLPEPSVDLRKKYQDVLGETSMSFTTKDLNQFRPQTSDPINGNLGDGEVGMDQIMSLLNTK
jgi:hypothetical protein